LELETVDAWEKIGDAEAFAAARALMRTEGLLVGGSSGSAVAGALRYLKSEKGWQSLGGVEGKNVVVMLPDGARNYMSKPWFLNPQTSGPTPLAEEISKALGRAAETKSAPLGNGTAERLHVKPGGLSNET